MAPLTSYLGNDHAHRNIQLHVRGVCVTTLAGLCAAHHALLANNWLIETAH